MGKMIDLGKKYPTLENTAVGPSKDHISYPSIYVDGDKEIKGKVGGTIHAKVKMRKVSHTIRHEKSGVSHSQSFDVMAIDPGESSADDDMDDAMDEGQHQDGGRVNSQSQIMAGLDSAEKANDIKTKKEKKG